MIFYLILGFAVVGLISTTVATYKIRKAKQQVDNIMHANIKLLSEIQQLKAEKVVAQTQVKHFETRKKNEENNRTSDRNTLIDRLQQSNDLRD